MKTMTIKFALATLGLTLPLSVASPASAFMLRPTLAAPVSTASALEACKSGYVEGEDGMEPSSEACAEMIGEAFRAAFEDASPTPGGTGVSVDDAGRVTTHDGTYESSYDPVALRYDSVIGSDAAVRNLTDAHNVFNLDDSINTCLEYTVALNWDYFQFRKHSNEVQSAMEWFERGMTEAGGDVVHRLADGEHLRNRAYHGLAASTLCSGNAACLQDEDQPLASEAFPDTLNAEWFGANIRRNAYHMLNVEEMQQLLAREPALAFALAASQQQKFPNDWAQHLTRYEELRDEDPELLSTLYADRESFTALVLQRRAVAERLAARSYSVALQSQLDALDDQIAEALLVAQDNDCIGPIARSAVATAIHGGRAHDFTACDWAPNDFIAQFVAASEGNVTERYEACAQSPLAFGFSLYASGHDVFEYQDCPSGVVRNRTISQSRFRDEVRVATSLGVVSGAEDRVLACEVSAALAGQDESRMRLNYTDGQRREFGDPNWFAAGYEWTYDIGLIESSEGELCNVNPHAEAGVRAFYELRNRGEQEIAAAELDLNARRGAKRLDVIVLGNDLVNLSGESDGVSSPRLYNYTWTTSRSVEQDVTLADFNFSIPSVPANIGVGAGASVGFEGSVSASFGELQRDRGQTHTTAGGDRCYVFGGEITGELRPYANANAFVSAAFGFDKWGVTLEGGIQANVVLIEAALPVSAGMALTTAPDFSDIQFDMNFDVDFELSSLDGNVVAYAEGGIGAWSKRWESELFAFNGFTRTFPLIDAGSSYDFEVWAGVCEHVDCVE